MDRPSGYIAQLDPITPEAIRPFLSAEALVLVHPPDSVGTFEIEAVCKLGAGPPIELLPRLPRPLTAFGYYDAVLRLNRRRTFLDQLSVPKEVAFDGLVAPLLFGALLILTRPARKHFYEMLDGILKRPPTSYQHPRGDRLRLTPHDTAALRQLCTIGSENTASAAVSEDASLLILDPAPWRNRLRGTRRTRQRKDEDTVPQPEAASARPYIPIPNPGHYVDLQRALSLNTFARVDGTPFPRARLQRGQSRGFAELRPITPEQELLASPEEISVIAERVWAQREELSDKDADTLDMISTAWIQKAKSPQDRVPVYLDDLLRLRGLTSKKNASGRRGGFEAEQREDLWRCLLHLQDLWLDLAEAPIVEKDINGKRSRKTRAFQSRAFLMTDRVGQRRLDGSMDVEAILVTPGAAFGRFLLGPGRQVALLSSAALQYDPLRQKVEKRLARFLSWQWRVGARKGDFQRVYRVETLLEEIGLDVNPDRPAPIRNTLERALTRLQDDAVIAAWQYGDGWNEDALPRQNWFRFWREARILVEAPDLIKNAYRNTLEAPVETRTLVAQTKLANIGAELRDRRAALRVSQVAAAEQIGVGRAYLAQIEMGRAASPSAAAKILRWLAENPAEFEAGEAKRW
jgi:DNA-binding transcriptional regulator YiaG